MFSAISPNPYGPNPSDYLSNLSKFQIIESTLREGEQFANAFFTTLKKIEIAKALDDFGVDYIELTSPTQSPEARKACEAICSLGLRAKILTHIPCRMEDAEIAVQTGVHGVDIVIEASQFKNKVVAEDAVRVIEYIKSKGVEMRFSSEDSFRSDLADLIGIYTAINKIGVDRVGIADTIGCANPRQVYELVRTLKSVVACEIECHFHNDTGCAIANAYTALEAGAKMVDVSVLGIGERNGITPLGGFISRMIAADRAYVLSKYKLHKLRHLENLVAEAVRVNIPFNNPITGFCAFTHKAGPHARAILATPTTYEILKPSDFGLTRYIHFANRLTGWSAIKSRVDQLNLSLSDEQCKDVTERIKKLGDVRPLNIDDVDSIIKNYHADLSPKEDEKEDEKENRKDEASDRIRRGIDSYAEGPGAVGTEASNSNVSNGVSGVSGVSNSGSDSRVPISGPGVSNGVSGVTNSGSGAGVPISGANGISDSGVPDSGVPNSGPGVSNSGSVPNSGVPNSGVPNSGPGVSNSGSVPNSGVPNSGVPISGPDVSNSVSNSVSGSNSAVPIAPDVPSGDSGSLPLEFPDFLGDIEFQNMESMENMDNFDQALDDELRELNEVFNGDLDAFNVIQKVATPDMNEYLDMGYE